MPSNMDDKAGVDNLDAALSGDQSLHGANKDQISALGGEFDDDLDGFASTPEDRGDVLETAEDRGDDVKEEEEADEEEAESSDDETDAEGEESDADADADAEEETTDDEESDEESDEEGDDSDQEADKDDSEKPKKVVVPPGYLPKHRFDEVNARRKAAEEELAALKAESTANKDAAESKYDFDAAREEYGELLISGKTKEAAAKLKEISTAERADWEAEAVSKSTSNVSAQQVQNELQQIVAQYEGEYAEFNPENENYSEDIVDEVEAFFTGYLNKRPELTPQQAFHLAVDNTARLYGLQKQGESATEGDDSVDEPAAKKTVTRKVAKKDTKKKIALAQRAPANTSKAGNAGDSSGESQPDINQMTDDEFDALPDSVRARLRGDTV